MMARRLTHSALAPLAEAEAYIRAGGRPEAVPVSIRVAAWRRAGRMTWQDIGAGWLMPYSAGDGQQVTRLSHGVPMAVAWSTTEAPLHPVKRYDGPVEGMPEHALPAAGREQVFVTIDGQVHRGLYWSGNYNSAHDDTGNRVAGRIARDAEQALAG